MGEQPTTPGTTPAVAPATPPALAATTPTPDTLAVEGNEQISLEEARKLRKENQTLRARQKAIDDAEALRQQEALSNEQKAAKRAEEAEARYQQEHKQHIKAIVQLAASKKGIIDPDLAALAIETSLEFGDDGLPSNLDKALDDLIKNKPYLAAKPAEQQPASPAQTARPPQVPAMNPGRSTIQPQQPQGPFQPTRFTDVFKRP